MKPKRLITDLINDLVYLYHVFTWTLLELKQVAQLKQK